MLNVETGIRDIGSLLGQFDFEGRFTGNNGRWENAVADLLLGFPRRYQQDSNTTFKIYQHMYFGFLQDDWRVSGNLTVNLGLRYEFATPPRERDLKWANFDPAAGKFITAAKGSLRQEALIEPDRNDFAPRIGFAYTVTPKTVIRAGYGVFYNHANRDIRPISFQKLESRCSQHAIAHGPQTNDGDTAAHADLVQQGSHALRLRFDARLIHQHHRDIVTNRIHTFAGDAF